MNKLTREWIDALRSGKYEQGDGYLRLNDEMGGHKYCCLGVLCEIVRDKGWVKGRWEGEDESFVGGNTDFISESNYWESFPPDIVWNLTGLADTVQEHLATLNDNGKDFLYIADEIEWIVKHRETRTIPD